MNRTEKQFEQSVLDALEASSWRVIRGGTPDETTHTDDYAGRDTATPYFDRAIETNAQAVNDELGAASVRTVTNQFQAPFNSTEPLSERNKQFLDIARHGVSETLPANTLPTTQRPFDFADPSHNEFVAVQQLTVTEAKRCRPDIVLFINGFPVVVVELKSVGSGATATEAIHDISNKYEQYCPSLFASNVLNIAANQVEVRYGAIEASDEHYHQWAGDGDAELSTVEKIQELCDPAFLLEIIEKYTFFQDSGSVTPYSKILPRHQQYHASERIIEDITQTDTDSRHLIVHVQGSGKSIAMMYAAQILHNAPHNNQIFIIVDEKGLETQFYKDIEKTAEMSVDKPATCAALERLVRKGKSGIVVTTIHKFNDVEAQAPADGAERVVFADEAHRYLQENMGSQMMDILGSEPSAGAAEQGFSYYGFTGTPLNETYEFFTGSRDDRDLHTYSMADAVAEDQILPVNIEDRSGTIEWEVDWNGLDDEFEELTGEVDDETIGEMLDDLTQRQLAKIPSRVTAISDDIATHFEREPVERGFKGMVITASRASAAMYGDELSAQIDGTVEVLYSGTKNDSQRVEKYVKSETEQEQLIADFKTTDSVQLLVVCDMLLTGFDAPQLQTIYLDRSFTGGHTLMQALSRSNRNTDAKEFGEIIDYQGCTEDIESKLAFSTEDIDDFSMRDKETLKTEFTDELAALRGLFSDDCDLEDASVKACVDALGTPATQSHFESTFTRLRSLHTNISPDPFLTEYTERYKELEAIYHALGDGTGGIDIDWAAIIENNTDIHRTDDEPATQTLRGTAEDGAAVTTKRLQTLAATTSENTQHRGYDELSKRVEAILRRWNQNKITTLEASQEVDKVEAELESLATDIAESDLSQTELALKYIITNNEAATVDAAHIAQHIYTRFKQKGIDEKEDWPRSESSQRSCRRMLRTVVGGTHQCWETLSASTEELIEVLARD